MNEFKDKGSVSCEIEAQYPNLECLMMSCKYGTGQIINYNNDSDLTNMQKFIVPDIQKAPSKAVIVSQDAKHASKVLRLRAGDRLTVTNGQGRDFFAIITRTGSDRIELNIEKELACLGESPLHITLCCGMLKDKKMDFVIKHTTQLGIYKWIPFFCERSVPKADNTRLKKRMQRWATIAGESLKQCGRSQIPEIMQPMNFHDLIEKSNDYDLKIAFWEQTTENTAGIQQYSSAGNKIRKAMILIGPEGGFSESEMHSACQKGFLSFSLGPRILRAETAAIAASSLIQHLLGDMGATHTE